ncbi:Similar to Adamts16: A disintegrin and metalloproteinase with thrombospondin motifs 16 (Mus musculus) [Cotesia congregata]|uniref:Similar to Adamts16: A disintegrin and metalloproteinase with thrombospondin motifs 16 (Mus musculus) n=1 Tax=Cotesia congregata TaxID=51543 RepID=A0A8J2HG97_COTCN|nr:Similar to Adamts16: A disintegrin and metalloproteinase with thrombospondin motifs 16 (Mus musculus) [Cotesia congregata]
MRRRQSSGIFKCKMIHIRVLLCMAVLSVAQCHQIHEHMTAEERLSVFHQTTDEIVPTYQVVPILHSVFKRSPEVEPEVHFKVFGQEYQLSLKPTERLFSPDKHIDMWTVIKNSSSPNGLDYEQEGDIGSELVIRPLSSRLNEIVSKHDVYHEPNLLPNVTRVKRSLSQTHHHIVYKRTSRPVSDEYNDFAFMEPDHLAKRFRSKRSINSRTEYSSPPPDVIYPEILCIVDYEGYRMHGGDNLQIKKYFVAFWNGVDLRYKSLKGPKIRISIAGIIISRGRDATPYLENNRVGRDAIDSAAALTDMGKYLFRERRLPVYDIAVAVTKLDMCRRQHTNAVCNRGTAGFAYVGGACVVNKRLEKVNSVAIIEDTGGFSGIIVAAHEVGHLLGAVHDGSPPPSYLGGPGAIKCRWEDGYIMSDLRHTEKGFKWSHCSVASFHHFLNGDTATCLTNVPHEDEKLSRVLPGTLLSLDAQCRKDRGTSACFRDNRVCAQLFCFDALSGYCVAYRPAAEGSSCGDGQHCLNGQCVAEHENIIPDYTQNIPSYVRHDGVYNNAIHSRPFSQYNHTDYRYQWESTTQNIQHTILPNNYNVYDNTLNNEVNPYVRKKYPNSVTTSTATQDENHRPSTGRETEDGECVDTATNCAEQIDRLRTWLCHLPTVKIRCCASLKGICR